MIWNRKWLLLVALVLLALSYSCVTGTDHSDDDDSTNYDVVEQAQQAIGDDAAEFSFAENANDVPIAAVMPGVEFRVNTYTTSDQDYPSVSMASDGRFVVAWNSSGQDGSDYGVYAQKYDATGTPQGAEFLVNTFTVPPASFSNWPSVAMGWNGQFVIAWSSYGQDGSGWGIYTQRYDVSGSPLGAVFRVNTYTTYDQWGPTVAMGSDGRFVVAWESGIQDGSGFGIYGQRYDLSGDPQGVEFRVNTYTIDWQEIGSVAMGPDGRFVVAWQSLGQDGDGYGIYAQRYDTSGSPQGVEFRVNTYTNYNQWDPAVAMGSDGRFVVAWESGIQDGDGSGIYAQRYDATGNPQGTQFRVNTYTTSDQQRHSVAMGSDGRFVVVWESHFQDGDGYGIYAQRYDASGNPQGTEFRVNTYTTSDQRWPSVAMGSVAGFVVAWTSEGQDGDSNGVYAKLFDCVLDADCPSDICTDGICAISTTTTSTSTTTSTTMMTTTTTSTSTQPPTTTTTSTTTTRPPTTTTSSTGVSTTSTSIAPSTTTTTVTTTTSTTTSTAPTDDDANDDDTVDDDTSADDTSDDEDDDQDDDGGIHSTPTPVPDVPTDEGDADKGWPAGDINGGCCGC